MYSIDNKQTYNNKIFDRNFLYNKSEFNVLDDRIITNNDVINDEKSNNNILNNRIFDINYSPNTLDVEDYFRNINRQNFDGKNDKMTSSTNNKLIKFNNHIINKMIIFYQYYMSNKIFGCSTFYFLIIMSVLSNIIRDVHEEIDNYKIEDIIELFNKINNKNINIENNFFLKDKIKYLNNFGNILYNKDNNIITNTITFTGNLKIKFSKNNTVKKDFYNLVNSVKIDTMHAYNVLVPFYENEKYQIIELPYENDLFVFGVVVYSLYNNNDVIIPPYILDYVNKLQNKNINIQIPKIKIKSKMNLNKFIKTINMGKIFNNNKFNINGFIQKININLTDSNGEINKNTDCDYNFIANNSFTFYIRYVPDNNIILQGLFSI